MEHKATEENQPEKVYQNENIKVFWKPGLCQHSTNCVKGLPQVFQSGERPWIKIGGASAVQIAETILTCPSGALSYELIDNKASEGKDK